MYATHVLRHLSPLSHKHTGKTLLMVFTVLTLFRYQVAPCCLHTVLSYKCPCLQQAGLLPDPRRTSHGDPERDQESLLPGLPMPDIHSQLVSLQSLTVCLSSLRWPKSIILTPTKKTHKPRKSLLSWLKLMRFSVSLLRVFPHVFIISSSLNDLIRITNLLEVAPCFLQVLSDEGKRKQYDTYGSAGFDAGRASGGQHYWTGQTSNVDPEELFRKIFGEFSGGRGFGDFNAIFDQPQEVSGKVK